MLIRLWLGIYLMALICLYFISRGKEQHLFKDLDQKAYPLKGYLPMGHFILNRCGYQYRSLYDQKLTILFNQIYGTKEGKEYNKVHWANQITLLLIVILLVSFFAVVRNAVDGNFISFSLIMMAVVIYGLNKEVYEKVKERQIQIKLDFTEFLSKLILLVNAGLNVSYAWEKIVTENTSNRPLYKELRIAINEIKSGRSEEETYEDFANRCRNPLIFKFVSLIIQNLKKGNAEIVIMLRLLTNECWEMRKSVAKTLGEEASTKLLIPMMIMFIAILLIVITPAILILASM